MVKKYCAYYIKQINDYVSKIGNILSDSVDMKRLKLVD